MGGWASASSNKAIRIRKTPRNLFIITKNSPRVQNLSQEADDMIKTVQNDKKFKNFEKVEELIEKTAWIEQEVISLMQRDSKIKNRVIVEVHELQDPKDNRHMKYLLNTNGVKGYFIKVKWAEVILTTRVDKYGTWNDTLTFPWDEGESIKNIDLKLIAETKEQAKGLVSDTVFINDEESKGLSALSMSERDNLNNFTDVVTLELEEIDAVQTHKVNFDYNKGEIAAGSKSSAKVGAIGQSKTIPLTVKLKIQIIKNSVETLCEWQEYLESLRFTLKSCLPNKFQ